MFERSHITTRVSAATRAPDPADRASSTVVTTLGPRSPLRLLLVTDGKTIPNWLFNCIEEVEQSGAGKVVLVMDAGRSGAHDASPWIQQLRQLLFRLYRSLDRHVFRTFPDAVAPVKLESLIPNSRVIRATDGGCRLVDSVPASVPLGQPRQDDADQIDLVLDPFSLTPDGWLAERLRYGVWRIAFGQSGDPKTQATPAFWEVVEGRPATEARLCVHWQECDRARVLYLSVAPTDRRSVSRSQNHAYWKISAALARKIQLLWEDPEAFLERLRAAAPCEVTRGPSIAPGNLEVFRAWTSLAHRYVSDKWTRTFYREQWALAFHRGRGDHLITGAFDRVVPPMDRFWADPFPIQMGSDYYIFHEELRFSTGKGTIVMTVVDEDGRVAGPIPILERNYHLSYPFVFEWDGQLFMIPETGSRHQVELYRCVQFPLQWTLERVLLSGVTALDPTLAFLAGRWWLFANVPAYGALGTNDELHLFHADSPLGPWSPHRNNPIKSDVHSSRPAGRIFEKHGRFYRPAQDCSKSYGHGVSINRILQLGPDTYDEVEVGKIVPNWGPSVVGVHTLNVVGNMTVFDCLITRNKFTARPRRHGQRSALEHPPRPAPR